MLCILCSSQASVIWGGFSLCESHKNRVCLARYETKWNATAIDIIEVLTIRPEFDFEQYETAAKVAHENTAASDEDMC